MDEGMHSHSAAAGALRPRDARRRVVVLVVTLSALAVAAVVVIGRVSATPLPLLTRDPYDVFQGPAYIGFLSQAGLLLWAGAAVVCFFAAAVAEGDFRGRSLRWFFLSAGAIMLWLGIDDALLLHERFLPNRGVPEAVVVVFHVAVLGGWFFRFFRLIISTDLVLFGMAVGFSALSVVLDFVGIESEWAFLGEDGAKFLGIAAWFGYFFCTALAVVRRRQQECAGMADCGPD